MLSPRLAPRRRGPRKETVARRSRFNPRHFCWRCGDPLKGPRRIRRCAPCQAQTDLEHEHLLELRMAGTRRMIDFREAPIARYAGWRRHSAMVHKKLRRGQ